MPWTPIFNSASRTSSILNGLMMAVTSFMGVPVRAAKVTRTIQMAKIVGQVIGPK
jgi:hypothetical protein